MFALKPFKFTYIEMKIFENTFLPSEDLQIHGTVCFPLPTSPLTPPLVMSNALNSCLEFATLKRGAISLYKIVVIFF
jgi:hypothetical protein